MRLISLFRFFLVALLLFLTLAAPGHSAGSARAGERTERTERIERIPFTLLNGLIWVKVEAEINGKKGRTRECQFVVDSGAGAQVVNIATARRLKLKAGDSVPVYGAGTQGMAYRLEGFRGRIGALPLSNEAYVVSLKRSKREKSRVIHGMLGQEFFRDRVVQIDFVQRQLLVHRGKAALHYRKGANRLPIRLHKDAMLVPISLNGGAKEWVRLDTGCTSALEWAGKGTFAQVEGRGKRQRGRAPLVYKADIALGSDFLPAVAIGVHAAPFFEGESGLLGNGLLSQYSRVTIDGRSLELVLER